MQFRRHWDHLHTLMIEPVHACHLFCISFQFSFQFGLTPILLTMQYDHSKCTLDYILVTTDLEKVEVVCTLTFN